MAVQWNENINKKILRSGTSWEETQGFIEDETKSGKPKRRMAHYMKPNTFSVKMRFSLEEYKLFRLWYRSSLSFGTLPFDFPQIDDINGQLVTYQFANGGSPKYFNPSGDFVEATMIWERVWQ